MRAPRVAAVAAMAVLAACSSGQGGGAGPERPVERGAAETSSPPPVASTEVPTTAAPSPVPEGSVRLRVTGLSLPGLRSGGSGLRLVVRSASPRLTVRRTGGQGAVDVCPVTGATSRVAVDECAGLGADTVVELASPGGVELRATVSDATAAEVAVTYVPVDRATTVVTPRRPAGACRPTACETVYSLSPGRAGPFTLTGDAGGGRPRLVVSSVRAGDAGAPAPPPGAGSDRTLATVEGGGSLSIAATVEEGWEARLVHHEQGSGAVVPVTAEILWP